MPDRLPHDGSVRGRLTGPPRDPDDVTCKRGVVGFDTHTLPVYHSRPVELQARGIEPRPAWSSFLYHQTDEGRPPAPAHLQRGVYPR